MFLSKPVTCQPAFFVLLYILVNVPDIYSLLLVHSVLPFFKVLSGLFICYLFALPVVLLPSSSRKLYKAIILFFVSVLFIVDVYLLQLYNETFATLDKNAVSAIIATNPSEAKEFVNVYLTFDKILIVMLSISTQFVIFFYFRKLHFVWNLCARFLFVILLICSVFVTFKQSAKLKDNNVYYLFTKECPNLQEYKQNPIVICSDENVENVVLVIGESFSKFHSSLYGYKKETNPQLKKLVRDSTLFVYDNVTSACVATLQAVKSIMMAYTDEMNDSIEWYRCLTLVEVMQKAGYRTYWLSNQAKTGFLENEIGRLADLCNEQHFIGEKHSVVRTCLDEELLPIVENCLFDSCKTKFVVLQLMGSHDEYCKRYPSEFSKFKSSDYDISYPDFSADKKNVIAEYDNSVFYNDDVVYRLMAKFCQSDAVVIYFSDHGEDVYRSSDDFCGHAYFGNEKSTAVVQQIPFMVYTSPLFREKHPELQQRIENAVSRPYRTDSIMYTIMDVAGVESVNSVSYKQKSLFK